MNYIEIYSDGYSKIKGKQDELTRSIVLKVEYKNLQPGSISFPNDAIDKIVVFLGNCKKPHGEI